MSKGKNFSLTYNNPTSNLTEFMDRLKIDAVYARCQMERGDNGAGTLHYQACVGYSTERRKNRVIKDFPGCHVEVSRNAMAAWNYCGKKESRVPDTGVHSHGLPPASKNVKGDTKKKNEMILEYGLAKAITEGLVPIEKAKNVQAGINLFHALNRNAVPMATLDHEWHWGKTGLGKSRTVREKYPDAYLKGCNLWWCNYANEEVVIIEDLGFKTIAPQHLKVWGDHYPFTCEGKGYSLGKIRPKKIIVTSNWSIRELYPDPQDYEAIERRFKVHHHEAPMDWLLNI